MIALGSSASGSLRGMLDRLGQRTAAALLTAALASCTARAAEPDVGPLLDVSRPPYAAPDASGSLAGYLQVRLANLAPASPNLTVCLSTVAGTGAPETTGHILGEPDPAAGLDGTLPYPGVSSYIPVPYFSTPGFGYVVRLYDRAVLPFALGGTCPPADGDVAPLFTAELEVGPLVSAGALRATVIAAGVLPGTPTLCMGGCPPPQVIVVPDDPTPSATGARIRVVHAVPNLPVPIEICLDPDQIIDVEGGVFMNGPIPSMRVLPESTDTDGLRFGETSAFIDAPPLQTNGVLYVHAVAAGVPSCNPATLLLGPYPIPLPLPAGAPPEVASTLDVGDVITAFAFGRVGGPCEDDGDCLAPLGGTCNTMRMICQDALSPSVLPWQDVIGPPAE